jgi:hypothetical protein
VSGSLKLLKELNICKISEAALVQPMDDKKQHSRSLSVPFNDEVQAAPVAFRSCSPQSLTILLAASAEGGDRFVSRATLR